MKVLKGQGLEGNKQKEWLTGKMVTEQFQIITFIYNSFAKANTLI